MNGHEQVVPLAFCTPPVGAKLFSGHADVTGFKHTQLNTLPIRQLVTGKAECTSIDFCESSPSRMAIVTSNDWYGDTTEIFTSSDSGDTFTKVNTPPQALNGKIAVAANDHQNMVYLRGGASPSYTFNGGASWQTSTGAPTNALGETSIFQFDDPLISDRRANNTFYLFVRQEGKLYKSSDGGARWNVLNPNSLLPVSSYSCNLAAG